MQILQCQPVRSPLAMTFGHQKAALREMGEDQLIAFASVPHAGSLGRLFIFPNSPGTLVHHAVLKIGTELRVSVPFGPWKGALYQLTETNLRHI
ncbi:MAG: hypothetical protein V2I43_26040 [Parvularcula sp.]|jgi:hypothetical protein|nr:hypothetical protein [Parvularcula sp.]